ncbi:adenylate/guanylate cyclase domain-containing protein [Tepidamorphus sp. 3E244]|uniref:adenylate/guanylate cyclase domain-containing protein n=1 Tax=Tepidamorphus sp. 3E244 TaxID=3385498 RepID=UPI0038FCCF33
MNQHVGNDTIAIANRASPVLAWLLSEGLRCDGVERLTQGFSEHLVEAGLPISRLMISTRVLTATVIARSVIWTPEGGISTATYDWAERDLGLYETSPIKAVHDTLDWVDLVIDETPDEAFGIVPDLREKGVTNYVALPLQFTNGTVNALSISTTSPEMFSQADKDVLNMALPAFAAAVELRMLDTIMREVLSIYVGEEPAKRILSGTVHRGEVTRISSAIMFVDMRDFTRRTQNMSAEDTAELLNRYYDCVVPNVTANGGSVLKFIGDGILAIFPDGQCGAKGATASALKAAKATLAAVPGACSGEGAKFEIGIALHYGQAAFGNVGSGERLDFTVVGRDVNLTDRVGRLNKKLGIPLLLSEAFCAELDSRVQSCGHHAVASFDDVIEVFQPV